jgi:hypothetical protein
MAVKAAGHAAWGNDLRRPALGPEGFRTLPLPESEDERRAEENVKAGSPN